VAALADGGVSKPFRTDAGFHIVQRFGTRQGSSNQSQRTQMREAIGRRKLEDEYNRYLRECAAKRSSNCACRPPRRRPAGAGTGRCARRSDARTSAGDAARQRRLT
jgi:hypothetical protein